MFGKGDKEKEDSKSDIMDFFKHAMIGRLIEERMLQKREIFLWEEISDETAKSIVQKLIYFDGEEKKDITLYINSPGGVISSGLAIYDAMVYCRSDIVTVCMGQAASMASVILAAGTKGKRYAWENARVMIHQPLIAGNMYGPASDIQIQAEELLRVKGIMNKILSKHTGKSLKDIDEDTDRDYFLSSEDAQKYGLIDKVLKSHSAVG